MGLKDEPHERSEVGCDIPHHPEQVVEGVLQRPLSMFQGRQRFLAEQFRSDGELLGVGGECLELCWPGVGAGEDDPPFALTPSPAGPADGVQ